MTAPAKIKNAMHMRGYGASELMLATATGEYPPPHAAMDALIEEELYDAEVRAHIEECADFDKWFRAYEASA